MTRRVRCAIYTRKSSEEGLDQAFNSLDAQREACEAYVLSQAGEGWTALSTVYDDGGYSGGTMERPALKRLLRDIERGLIDVVVVYKVDRLSRALTDFARIVEAFDARGVSFVSVTQAFNTTSSMGRLTLNVLLSFAQFEREVTGERIRDKIAASKKKGMWMGGVPPLGYDLPADKTTRALQVNVGEAEVVRRLFSLYLELGSVRSLQERLARDGVVSKAWVNARGQAKGGRPFRRGALFHLLKNRLYRGEITHKGACHPGQHPAIVEAEVFEAVQTRLAELGPVRRRRDARAAASPLMGRIVDVDGRPMSPAFAYGKGKRIYRYYVRADVQRGEIPSSLADPRLKRLPATILEALVLDRLQRLAGPGTVPSLAEAQALRRVEVRAGAVHLLIDADLVARDHHDLPRAIADAKARLSPSDCLERDGDDGLRLIVPAEIKPRGGRCWMVGPDGGDAVRPSRRDPALIKALRRAHAVLARSGAGLDGGDLTDAEGIKDSFERRLVELAFLAPDIQRAILEGRQPPGLTLQQLIQRPIPLVWSEQRSALGFTSVSVLR